MATIRPNAEPAATTVAAGDIFLIDGATGVRALAASVVPLRDANANVAVNNVALGYATTATAAGTTVLTAASAAQQFFTGTTTQIAQLPVTSTLQLGQAFAFQNDSTGAVTIQSSGANTVVVMAPGTDALITCILLTGTTAASWDVIYFGSVMASGKVLTVSNSLTLAGTDGTTMTFPATNATVARTDAGQTFTGTNAFGVLTATTVNGNTITTGTGILTIAALKTLTVNNSLTLAGTDSTTLTFPTTNATVARTDAGQTFTGGQTFSGALTYGGVTLSNAVTGTGNMVLSTSPTLTTPAIGAATGTSLVLTGGSISFATSGQGHIGTTTNDNAAAGILGEYIESVITSGSAVSLVTATAKTVTSISLTAGDWDVDCSVSFVTASTTNVTEFVASISATTNTVDATPGKQTLLVLPAFVPTSGTTASIPVPPYRLSLSGTTNVFLIALGTFTVSTLTAYGIIRARRCR